jgi:hypothetical protein
LRRGRDGKEIKEKRGNGEGNGDRTEKLKEWKGNTGEMKESYTE